VNPRTFFRCQRRRSPSLFFGSNLFQLGWGRAPLTYATRATLAQALGFTPRTRPDSTWGDFARSLEGETCVPKIRQWGVSLMLSATRREEPPAPNPEEELIAKEAGGNEQ
jgi:hypothetical protein